MNEREMDALLDLIDQYGDECATCAYHGELHCRKKPEQVFKDIKAMLELHLQGSPSGWFVYSKGKDGQWSSVMIVRTPEAASEWLQKGYGVAPFWTDDMVTK